MRAAYSEHVAEANATRQKTLRRAGVDEVQLETDGQVVEPLLRFFRTRETRARAR